MFSNVHLRREGEKFPCSGISSRISFTRIRHQSILIDGISNDKGVFDKRGIHVFLGETFGL